MIKLSATFTNFNLENSYVIVRADLNVPLNDGQIINDYRLLSILPTIDRIREKKGKIVLLTHIGRPTQADPALSTRHLMNWFAKHGYNFEFAPDIQEAKQLQLHNAPLILFENLRFFAQEKAGDQQFAKQLAELGTFYVNDAFATMHRSDTSITLLAQLFGPNHKSIGLLVEKELTMLNKLLGTDKKGFVLVLGGGKVADKLPLLAHLITKVETILLCPALCFTFAKALGKAVRISLVDDALIARCRDLLHNADAHKTALVMPQDYHIAYDNLNGAYATVDADDFPANGIGLSIGPKTTKLYCHYLTQAHTIFFNAAMGFLEKPETLRTSKQLLEVIAKQNVFSVIGGGESVALAQEVDAANNFSYLSTGGGATLAYLGGQRLPGLDALAQ